MSARQISNRRDFVKGALMSAAAVRAGTGVLAAAVQKGARGATYTGDWPAGQISVLSAAGGSPGLPGVDAWPAVAVTTHGWLA